MPARFALLLLLAALAFGGRALAKTHLLFANVTTGRTGSVALQCVNDDFSDAIAWIASSQKNLLEDQAVDGPMRNVEYAWTRDGWAGELSYKANFGPVTDYTWEQFPTIMTKGAALKTDYNFVKVAIVRPVNQFELNFSFLGKSNAQVYLCESEAIYTSACYIIILGGWGGTGSILRWCKVALTNSKQSFKTNQCLDVISKVDHRTLFSERMWSQISIRYYQEDLQVFVDNVQLMEFRTADAKMFNFDVRVFVHSYTENALWKYHDYTYYEARTSKNYIDSGWFRVHDSNQSCISFLANFRSEIRLELFTYKLDSIKVERYPGYSDDKWHYNTFTSAVEPNSQYLLRINFAPYDIAIRNIVIHDCLRKYHISALSAKEQASKDIQCTSLRNSDVKLGVRTVAINSTMCQADDEQCQSCTKLYQSTECPHRMTCNKHFCYCSKGCTGSYCEKDCDRGTYGVNCASKCGKCKNGNPCRPTSGECVHGCANNYLPPKCEEKDLPVLTSTVSIQTECINSCRIRLYDDSLQYEGRQKPTYYFTRLHHPNRTVEEGRLTTIKEHEIAFTNLSKSSSYSYEVILCVTGDRSKCYTDELAVFAFATNCEDLKEDQIHIRSADTLTIIFIQSFDATTQCDLRSYYSSILDTSGQLMESFYLSQQQNVSRLNVYQWYTLRLNRDGRTVHNVQFQTDEGIPNAVHNAKVKATFPTRLILTWGEPVPKRGNITNYFVEWEWVDKIDCPTRRKAGGFQSINVTTTTVELTNLSPYSVHKISICAYTKKGRGASTSISGFTEADDVIVLQDLQYDSRSHCNDVTITLNVDCRSWNGPLFLLASATCTSDWCRGEERNVTQKVSAVNNNVTIWDLRPYTEYTLKVYLSRVQKQLTKDSGQLPSKDIMTLPSAPNAIPFAEVYSLSETSLSLRWSAPYPPTGVLHTFSIKYYCNKYYCRTHDRDSLTRCKIWSNMYCATLTDLSSDLTHTISIKAYNKHPTDAGPSISLLETTKIRVPEQPLCLQGTWDESRCLILQWQHPNKTNGPLVQFVVQVNQQSYKYIAPPNLTYVHNTKFQCTPERHYADIKVKSVNTHYESTSQGVRFACPVFKPKFSSEPFLSAVANNSLTVTIPHVNDVEASCNLYVLVLTHHPSEAGDCRATNGKTLDILIAMNGSQVCWILRQYQREEFSGIVGSKVDVAFKQMPTFNFMLEVFEVGMLLVNEYDGKLSYNWYQLDMDASSRMADASGAMESSAFSFWWLALMFLLAAIVVAVSLLWRTQPTWLSKLLFTPAPGAHADEAKQPDLIPLTGPMGHVVPTLPPAPPADTLPSSVPSSVRPPVPKKPSTRAIAIAELETYVKNAVQNGELEDQHEKLKKGLLKPTESATRPENLFKNRYKNLMAYDHTRVKLKCVNGKPSTDYINANYIKSSICERAFIATQGPTDATLYDFWFMILTEGVQNLIMLANLVENGKQKVSAYWPDFKKMNKLMKLDDIEVCATGEKSFYNFVIRTFNVNYNGVTTEITQHHFNSWPDHGVPMYPHSLVPFVAHIRQIPHSSEHPILVHCSAGVGRTGTIILIDNCLRQIMRTRQVDPFHEFALLREQRANMVDNIEQYKLVHLVLLEYFAPHKTTHSCEEFGAIYENLSDVTLQSLLQYIETSSWQESAIIPDVRHLANVDAERNRDAAIVPSPYGVVYLCPRDERDTKYINAVNVDGFDAPKRFVATQHPLANTVDDFWRLVADQDAKLVISLQRTYDVEFWKNGGDYLTPGGTCIEHIESVVTADYEVHSLDVTPKRRPKMEIKLIEMNGWQVDENLPKDLNSLLAVWHEMNRIKLQDPNVIIMCRNGATACGLYIGMTNILDRMLGEQVVDVCKSVRVIRRSRKQFVSNIDQLRALYRLAALHLSEFEIYSNFSPVSQ